MRKLFLLLLSTTLAFGQAGRPPIELYSQLRDVDVTGLSVNNIMLWNGTVWVPGTAPSGSGLPPIAGQGGKFLTTDATSVFWGTVPFASLSSKPTTAAGYGIVGGTNLDVWGTKTPYAGSLVITTGKTVTFNNTFSISSTDGAALNIGSGGTLGTNAFSSAAFVLQTTTVNGHALSGNVTVAKTDLGLGYLFSGAGSPEGAIAAPVGSQYSRTDGGTGTSFYVKELGTGNTGWAASGSATGGMPTGGTVGQVIVKNSSTNFDASWANDPGSPGTGAGTVTSVSVTTANGVSATCLTCTTTPAFTFSLGAITPSSVASTGTVTGTNLSGTNTGDQTITLTGPVTGSGTGSFSTTITDGAVGLAKIANIPANTILGNNTVGLTSPIALSPTQTKTVLSLSNVENTALSTWAGSTNITTVGNLVGSPPTSSVAYSLLPVGNTAGTVAPGNDIRFTPGEGVMLNAGTTAAPVNWASSVANIRVCRENVELTGNHFAFLPAANSFPAGTVILYLDDKTGATNPANAVYGRTFRPVIIGGVSDTINGIGGSRTDPTDATADVSPFKGGAYGGRISTQRFETDGVHDWKMLDTGYRIVSFMDANDPTKFVTVNVSGQHSGVPHVFIPHTEADSYSVPDSTPVPGQFVTRIVSGNAVTSAVGVHDLISTQFNIDASKIVNAGSPPNVTHTATVPDDGTVDNIRLSVPLDSTNSPLTIIMPNMVNGYGSGEIIRFYDATGTIDTTRTVTLKGPPAPAPNPQTFNGNNSLLIQESYAARALVADPATINWSTPTGQPAAPGGVGVQPFTNTSLVVAGGTATWTANTAFNSQNAKITLAGNTTLAMSGFPEGMSFRLIVKQPLSGGPYTVALPTGSLTPSNGLGILYLSTGAGAVDTVEGYFDGTNYHFRATSLNETASLISACSVLDYNITSGVGTLKQGTNANTLYFAGNFTAGGSGTYTVCRVTPWLQKVGAPTYNLSAEIWSNGKNATFTDGQITVGGTTLSSALGALNSADVGKTVTGTNFTASPATTISSVAAGVATLNQPTIGAGTTVSFTIVSRDVPNARLGSGGGVTSAVVPSTSLLVSRIGLTDVSITNASTTITTPSGSANTFSSADVGAPISGTGIPTTATIASINNANSAELSVAATGTTGVVPSVTIFGARPISFTGLNASITAGTKYWLVLYGDAVGGGTNQCAQVLASTVTGNSMLLSPGPPTTANLWLSSLGSSIPRMQTYH
jgi:hypothetical protein